MAAESAPHVESAGDYLEAGIAAAQAGQGPVARSLLTKVIELDERNAAAWLWLSRVVVEPEGQEICLENVLSLEPGNAEAERSLARLREKRAAPPPVPSSATLAPPEAPAPPAAAGAPGDTELPMPPLISLEDRYLCPYCATRTQFRDRKCPACGGGLWFRSRQQEERTQSRMGLVLALQSIAVGLNAAALVLLLLYVSLRVGVRGLAPMFRLYLGLPGTSPDVTEAALAILPRLPVVTLTVLLLLSVVVLLGMAVRWKAAFYLFLVSGAGLAITGLLTTLTLWPAVDLGDAVLNSVARAAMVVMDLGILGVVLWLALEVREDFFFEQERTVFRLAPQAAEGTDFMAHGQRYAQERMWALAAIHFQRAADNLTDSFEARLKLAATYGSLGRYGVARRRLEEARKSRPADPRVRELDAWLERRGGG
jgi:tetratricopeptide (TPR) repeat protein